METVRDDARLLDELALLYLALAHSTDDELSDDEINAIAGQLRKWQEVEPATVAGALKHALEVYVQESAADQVEAAIRSVRERLPVEQRQEVFDDLIRIAVADDCFRHEEGSFIARLARAWEMPMSGTDDGAATTWSILTQAEGDRRWSSLHDLALVYLTLAQQPDGELCDEELTAIADKISEWMPGAPHDEVLAVVRDAVEVYVQGPDERLFTESVVALGRAVPEHQRVALFEDLQAVARADGHVLDGEQRMIDRLVQAWSLPGAA